MKLVKELLATGTIWRDLYTPFYGKGLPKTVDTEYFFTVNILLNLQDRMPK